MLPLEDNFNDVLSKAARGLEKSPARLADETGLPLEKIRAVLGGEFDAGAVRALADCLELAPDRVAALGEGSYVPEPVGIEGLRQFTTPYDDMTVNAYLVWDAASKTAAVFDTGSDVGDVLGAAAVLGVRIEQVFLTHAHGDHIYDLDRLVEKTGARAWTPRLESVEGAEPFEPGREFSIGALAVETRLTCGHARGGVTYVVRGLARPVAICGDAMFAGSMGGGMVSYADAIRTNREQILTLPDETILAPGHGPLTTIGEQKRCNPFFKVETAACGRPRGEGGN
jgi:glyoxylase-like metal-dependent hydrolase (beta-lactamase superfamily II)